MKRILAAGAVALLAAPVQAAPLTSIFTSFAVVGDSLSDNGNTTALLSQLAPFLPPPAPPATPPSDEDILAAQNFERLRQPGVFSDGFTWAREFTDSFAAKGQTGANLSFAGATIVDNGDPVPDLLTQVFAPAAFPLPDGSLGSVYPDGLGGLLNGDGTQNAARRLGDRPLVAVFAGGNDFLNVANGLDQTAPDFTPLVDAMTVAQGTLRAGLQALAASGVRDLVVMNLPDIGMAPRFNEAPALFRTQLSAIADQYNQALSGFLDSGSLFGATVSRVDIFDALTNQALLDGAGIANARDACIRTVSLSADGCDGFLFFDDIHPTTAGHEIIADLTRDALAENYPALVPLPAPALMLLSALAGIGVLRRRRAAA